MGILPPGTIVSGDQLFKKPIAFAPDGLTRYVPLLLRGPGATISFTDDETPFTVVCWRCGHRETYHRATFPQSNVACPGCDGEFVTYEDLPSGESMTRQALALRDGYQCSEES